jgi:hypothetical protein
VEIGFLIDQVAADMKVLHLTVFFLGGAGLLPMILKVLLDSKPEVALEIVIAAKGKEWRMSARFEVLDVLSPHLHTALSLSLSLCASLGKSGDLVEIGFLMDQVAADMKVLHLMGFFLGCF